MIIIYLIYFDSENPRREGPKALEIVVRKLLRTLVFRQSTAFQGLLIPGVHAD